MHASQSSLYRHTSVSVWGQKLMPAYGINSGTSQADEDVIISSQVDQRMWEGQGHVTWAKNACTGRLRRAKEFGNNHHREITGHTHSFWLPPWASWTSFCEQEKPTVKGHKWCPWQILAAGRSSGTQGMPESSTLELESAIWKGCSSKKPGASQVWSPDPWRFSVISQVPTGGGMVPDKKETEQHCSHPVRKFEMEVCFWFVKEAFSIITICFTVVGFA